MPMTWFETVFYLSPIRSVGWYILIQSNWETRAQLITLNTLYHNLSFENHHLGSSINYWVSLYLRLFIKSHTLRILIKDYLTEDHQTIIYPLTIERKFTQNETWEVVHWKISRKWSYPGSFIVSHRLIESKLNYDHQINWQPSKIIDPRSSINYLESPSPGLSN